MHLQLIAISVHGLTCFVVFFYDPEIYAGWKKLFKIMIQKLFSSKRRLSSASSSGGSTPTNTVVNMQSVST